MTNVCDICLKGFNKHKRIKCCNCSKYCHENCVDQNVIENTKQRNFVLSKVSATIFTISQCR